MSATAYHWIGILVPLGMGAVCSLMLLELRQDAWDKAGQTSKNLVQVIERGIDRYIEFIDLALRSVVENLDLPDLGQIGPRFRQRILFNRAVNATDLGVMLVLDEYGNTFYDALGWPQRRLNNAGQDYVQAHKADPGLGLHVDPPLISYLMAKPIIVLSRRSDKAAGTFGGVVLVSLALSCFDRRFEQIALGRKGYDRPFPSGRHPRRTPSPRPLHKPVPPGRRPPRCLMEPSHARRPDRSEPCHPQDRVRDARGRPPQRRGVHGLGRYGHDVGDQVIRCVARVLRETGAVVGRLGGEEFAALMPGHGLAGAAVIAHRIRR